jgi:hypothetical protein
LACGIKSSNNKILRLVKGDITERNVDAIVNAIPDIVIFSLEWSIRLELVL